MGIDHNSCPAFWQWALTQLLFAPAFTAGHSLRDHICSHGPRHLRFLFRCETPVVEGSASGYRITPSHLIFTEPTLLRATARCAITPPLAAKPRRRRAWRFHGRNQVRKRSSRVAVASLPLLGAAARTHAWRFHGRHYMRQSSSRVVVFFFSPSPPLESSAPP
jgi:hypothetical protein